MSNSKVVGAVEMTPTERYLVEIDWTTILTAGQVISAPTASLVELPRRRDVTAELLEGPPPYVQATGAKTVAVVKRGLTRGRVYELEMTVTPLAGATAGSTEARRIEITCV